MSKTIIFLGSSVTYGSAAGGVSFADIICKRNGYKMVKEAVSGTTLVDDDDSSYVSRLKKMETGKADLFVCQLSTNDATCGKPLGSISSETDMNSFDLHTIAGAMEFIIAYVKERWGCPVAFYTGTRYDSEAYAAMVELLKEIAQKWNVHVINLWENSSLNAIGKADYERYMADPIHPTLEGYQKWWTPFMEKSIEKINF